MNKFYFVQSSYAATKACAMELEIRRDATRRYLHHIIREDDIPAIVEELQELQADYCAANRRVRQVEIKAHGNPMVDGLRYIYIGNSFLSLIEVKGSEKEATASELFNDGWWNCLLFFSLGYCDALGTGIDEVLFDLLSDAGVSGPEALMRARRMQPHHVRDIVERYGETKFVE